VGSRTPTGLKGISSRGLSLDRLEVLDGAGAAQVEEVLADAAVASAASLPAADVRESVLDGDSLAELGSAGRGLLQLAQLVLEPFILGDGDGPAAASTGGRALGPQAAVVTCFGVELDDRAETRCARSPRLGR
jgi:hypothetical protein